MGGQQSMPATDEDSGHTHTTSNLSGTFSVSAPDNPSTIELLLQTLPVLQETVRLLLHSHLNRSKQLLYEEDLCYEFLTHFNAAATVLAGHLSSIEDQGAAVSYKTQIEALATSLEGLLDVELIAVTHFESPCSKRHVRLHALRRRICTLENWQARLGDFGNILSIVSQSQCDEVHEAIESIARELERFGENLPTDSSQQDVSDPSEASLELGAFADHVFHALSCAECNGGVQQHEARLKLGSYNRELHDSESRHLCVLLACPIPLLDWSETAVYDIKHSRSTEFVPKKVRFEAKEQKSDSESHWRSIKPKSHSCLCKTLEAHSRFIQSHRLNLTFSPSQVGIESHKPSKRIWEPNSLAEQVSLSTLLRSPDKKWLKTAELTLSLILAYSLFYLYGGPWATDRWSRKNIIFFKHGDRIPLRPFLCSDPAGVNGPIIDSDSFHGYPEILELGVILLEIHIGKSLESYSGEETVITTNDDLYAIACEIFEHEQENIPVAALRDAIKKCLDVGFDLDGSDQAPRKWLFKEVIYPIQDEMRRSFKNFISVDRLDEDAENRFDLAPSGGYVGSAKSYSSVNTSTTMISGITQNLVILSQKAVASNHESSAGQSLGGAFVTREDVKSSSTWFERLDGLVNVMRARKKNNFTDNAYKPVKVAVLDTGLKPEHIMADKVHYKDFVDPRESSRKDNTSHGTVSVDLILKIYEEAELYVARVFETDQADKTREPNQMADAIDWALEQEVDIISISAGFLRDYRRLREAVHKANTKNVLLFAAASNWGNLEGSVAYPARIKDHVFCIFSSNGALQARSNMNPKPRVDADNFAILGEDIHVYPGTGDAPVSGTSMATALAAGLAARILDFARHKDSRKADCDAEQLGTKAGMRAVFKKITRLDQGYQCIAPWLLWELGRTKKTDAPSRMQIHKVIVDALQEME